MKDKFNIFKWIVIILVVIILIMFIRKIVIIENLVSKASQYENSDNYHSTYYNYYEDTVTSINSYVYKDKYYRQEKIININTGEILTSIEEKYNGNEVTVTTLNNQNEVVDIQTDQKNSIIPIKPISYYLNFGTISNRLKTYLLSHITQTTCNGEKCYRIINLYNTQSNDTIVYINKETGLPVRSIEEDSNGNYSQIVEFEFEFNSVSDNDPLFN